MEVNQCLQEIGTLITKILTDFDSPSGEKSKTGDIHSADLSALFKNSAENNNNGAKVGQKRPIKNSDGGNNTPAKVPRCQNLAKIVSDVEVDLEILNQAYQRHRIPSKPLQYYIRETGIGN